MSVFKSRKERDVFKLLTSSYFTSIDVKKSNGKIDLYENLPATFAPKILDFDILSLTMRCVKEDPVTVVRLTKCVMSLVPR